MTKDDILRIASAKGVFRVTLRWRDDKLRSKCYALRKEGKLVGGRKIVHSAVLFYPVKETANVGTETNHRQRGRQALHGQGGPERRADDPVADCVALAEREAPADAPA